MTDGRDLLNKRRIHLLGATDQEVLGPNMFFRTVHNLKLVDYFWDFPFNIFEPQLASVN